MKESKIIIFVSIIMLLILSPIILFLHIKNFNLLVSIFTNIACGFVVALTTAIIEYFINKNRIKYGVYGLYFDIYYMYYCTIRGKKFFHYNCKAFYKKVVENNVKISSLLEEYNGFFHRKDNLFKIMNPEFDCDHLVGKILKSKIKFFNEKDFIDATSDYIQCVKKILININKKKFNSDFKNCMKLYDILF